MRISTVLLSMMCATAVVNAAPKATSSPKVARLTPKQLTDFMVANGDDASEKVAGRDSSTLLGLPTNVDAVPIKGDSTDDNEIGADTTSTCKVVVEKDGNKTKPVCMLILWERLHRSSHKLESYVYRFTTEGKLEKAVSNDAQLDDAGHGVPGSAKITPLDVNSPAVSKRAKDELAFWLKRTARVMAKKKAAASK